MISRFLNWLCWTIVQTFPSRTKLVEIEGDPYLLRFYIKRNGLLPGIYLHHFYRGDLDRELHDHPWKMSGSLILTGGYVEERLQGDTVVKRRIGPGRVNIIYGTTFHRVDLVESRAWTIFVSGKKAKDWGFYDPRTKTYTPHRAYLVERGRELPSD